MREDYRTVFSVARRIAREEEECPGEQRGGGVAAGEKEVQHLIAEFGRVTGLGGESVEEDVFFILLGVGFG